VSAVSGLELVVNVLDLINKVTPCWARLLLGRVTVCRKVNLTRGVYAA